MAASDSLNKLRVAVVGAGISGLSSAYQLLSHFHHEIQLTVLSKEHHADTTSYVAGGIWLPLGTFGPEADHMMPQIRDWFLETRQYFEKLIATGESNERGVSHCFAVDFVSEKKSKSAGINEIFLPILPFLKQVTKEELVQMYPHVDLTGIAYGNLISAFSCRPAIYLRWLEREIQRLGGTFIYGKHVQHLSTLEPEYDLVINTAALGAKETTEDENMIPIRGQIVYVDAPWVNTALFFGHNTYIIPGGDGSVSLGGCWQKGNDDTSINTDMKRGIFERCCKLIPSLKNARYIRDMVGLRPYRIGGPRIELEELGDSNLAIIHNYGHGSEGYGLHWGTSGKVVELFKHWKSSRNGSTVNN